MSVVKPITYTPSMLISTTAVESRPAYSATTTYAKDATVHHGGQIYTSLAASNTGHTPGTVDAALWWSLVGPDNRSAMFDDAVSTATTATNSLTVVLAPGIINSIGLFGLQGLSITITETDGPAGAEVYSKTFGLDGTIIADWYQYFFEPFVQQKELIITDLPPYGTSRLTITITGGGTVGVGTLVMGTVYDIGRTLIGVGLPTEDYSKVEFSEFGEVKLTRRPSSKRTTFQTVVPRVQLRKVYQVLDDLRATPAVWIVSRLGTDTPANVFGIRSSWTPVIDHLDSVTLSIELKGMT